MTRSVMARPLSLPLFPEEPPRLAPRAPAAPERLAARQLWMAVRFPRLALEALDLAPDHRECIAVAQGQGRNARVVDCTQAAFRQGVQPGLSLGTAQTLAAELRVKWREPAREAGALLRLAESGHRFTPTVSLEAPDSLLLEVEGSAHLFGGPAGIRARARQLFAARGYTAQAALAPTPLAALWLAHAGRDVALTERDALRSELGELPVSLIPWHSDFSDAFQRLGIKRLGDLLRLPRDGMAKRFGEDFLEILDRVLGQRPDPRGRWEAPRRCRFFRELPGEFSHLAHLQPFIEELVAELCRALRGHDAGTARIKLVFHHWRLAASSVTVGSAVPCRDESRWNALLQAQLANLQLAAPVHEVELLSGRLLPFTARNQDLLNRRGKGGESLADLIDLLRARLGRKAVFGIAASADARPERAWSREEPGAPFELARPTPARPVQVLPEPLPLACEGEALRYRGAAVTLIKGPERIEGGWWDGEDWVRDYFQAVSSRGERLWVFHARRRWFLHGLFS